MLLSDNALEVEHIAKKLGELDAQGSEPNIQTLVTGLVDRIDVAARVIYVKGYAILVVGSRVLVQGMALGDEMLIAETLTVICFRFTRYGMTTKVAPASATNKMNADAA